MAEHESTVNFQRLIQDLADMYPFPVEEVIVVEVVANALDAKAATIEIDFDPSENVLIISDDGKGMDKPQFEQYHDFAAGLKQRGTGIGFAGIGAKVSFNIAERVITETRSKSFSGGSDWFFKSPRKLTWVDIVPKMLRGNGTRVEIRFRKGFTPWRAPSEDVPRILLRYYLPLFDRKFLDFYSQTGCYSSSLRFIVNGKKVEASSVEKLLRLRKTKDIVVKSSAGKRFGLGTFGLSENEYALGEAGVCLCTWGKVIKRDLFNQFPGSSGPYITGLVEAPGLVRFLTTSKCDFAKRMDHREFTKLYTPIREEFRKWLGEIGVESLEMSETDESARLERELKKLVDDIPELAEFFGFRIRKKVLAPDLNGRVLADEREGVDVTFPDGAGTTQGGLGILDEGDEPGIVIIPSGNGRRTATPISRKAKSGPKISFAANPNEPKMSWVDGNNVVINSGHPCYVKSSGNVKAKRLHNMFAIATAIHRFLSQDAEKPDLEFVDRMMGSWGRIR
jgi:hypothetical protein